MQCQKCEKDTFLPFHCPYCGGRFCAVHRLPENHNCPQIELARAPRKENKVVVQKTNINNHNISFGRKIKVRRQVFFSLKEIKHLTLATLLVFGIGVGIWGTLSDYFGILFAVMLTASFLVHEIAHKIMAQRLGCWAEFRLTLWGAILSLISLFSPYKIISPGAVMIVGATGSKEVAKISLAGPLTNFVLSTIFLSFGFMLNSSVFFFLALINAYIAIFNLIPFGIFDGYKIFNWNKGVWVIAFTVSLVLTVVSYISFN